MGSGGMCITLSWEGLRFTGLDLHGSLVCERWKMFQRRTVLSQLPLTNVLPSGENARDETGPVWPA